MTRNQIIIQQNDSNLLGITNEEFHQNRDRKIEFDDRFNKSERLINDTLESLEKIPHDHGSIIFMRLAEVLFRDRADYIGWESHIWAHLAFLVQQKYWASPLFQVNLGSAAVNYFTEFFSNEFHILTYEQIEIGELLRIRRKVKDDIRRWGYLAAETLGTYDNYFEHLALKRIYRHLTKEFRNRQTISRQKNQLRISDAKEITTSEDKSENEDTESQSLRRKVIILMLLTFGRLDTPGDLTQEKVYKFFSLFTTGDPKRFRGFISNPTKYKEKKKASIKLLLDDLNFVRDELGKLGLNENVQKALNEIQFLIDGFNEQN